MNKLICFFPLLLWGLFSFSQADEGKVSGAIYDASSKEPLPFVSVLVKGSTKGVMSEEDGRYKISGLDLGQHTLVFSYLGYTTLEISISLAASKSFEKDVFMKPQATALEETVVSALAKKQSETALLVEQKKALNMKTSIGASELSRKGVSNLATAVTKTTGISKQEGGSDVFVRGLGDRYNITTLNGLPMPSNNARRKNISLNIFSTSIVESIAIEKTYNTENYGDFGGANINIISKRHSGKDFIKFDVKTGGNSNTIGNNSLYLQQGPRYYGFFDKNIPQNRLDKYSFSSWDKTKAGIPLNFGFSANGGKTFEIGNSFLDVFATASFGNNYGFTEGIDRGKINGNGQISGDYTSVKTRYNTNTTTLTNLAFRINPDHILKLNSLYINSSNQSHSEYRGVIHFYDNPSPNGFVSRSTFDRTSLFVNQVLGQHKLGKKSDLNWALGYNISTNRIPDRMQNTLVPKNNSLDNFEPSDIANSQNNRYFQTLQEDELATNIKFSQDFGQALNNQDKGRGRWIIGYSQRYKTVDFQAVQFNFNITRRIIQPNIDLNNIDNYFNQSSIDNKYFRITTFRGRGKNALEPQMYRGNQHIVAGFSKLSYALGNKTTALLGIRAERISQYIEWSTALKPRGGEELYKTTQILPSLSIKHTINDKQNLKFAISKSYTLPQFKERAPFQFEYVTRTEFGNKDLYASIDYNADIKWELFPSASQLLSLGFFGKYIQDPINQVVVASATNDISFVNTGKAATVFGTEMEIRKTVLDNSDFDKTNRLSLGFNASYMMSNQDFDSDKVSKETDLSVLFTNSNGKLTGSSDLILNADISYLKSFGSNKDFLATLTYNYFSDRVFAIGSSRRGNQIDKAVGTLDFILKITSNKKFNIGLYAKNIINPSIERIQNNLDQSFVLMSYKKGISTGISFSYKF